jgi:thymidylate kinase
MKILIEGPDGSGKTTLAKTLREVFHAEYVHYEYEPNNDIYIQQVEDVLSLIKASNENIIVDRFIPSEIIYGSILRDSVRMVYNKDNKWLEEMMSNFDSIIFCLPFDKERYLQTFKKLSEQRYELVEDIKQISKVYNYYQDLFVDLKLQFPQFQNKLTRFDFNTLL